MSGIEPLANSRGSAGSDRYLNRELSWLKFNERVLEEAANESNPLLERLKFLAIFESNLDEFYMVRVSGLVEQAESGVFDYTPDGLTPREQLDLIRIAVQPLRSAAADLWVQTLAPSLDGAGIRIRNIVDLAQQDQSHLASYFVREVFPLCTPLVLHPNPSVPFISNRSLNVGVDLVDDAGGSRLGRVKVPPVVPRFVPIGSGRTDFVLLEDLIMAHLDKLFPGAQIRSAHCFRVIRDADVEIRELEAADLITSVERSLHLRRFGAPVVLEVADSMPDEMRDVLLRLLALTRNDVLVAPGLLGLDALWELARLDKPRMRFPPFVPYVHESLSTWEGLLAQLDHGDVFVHHPYDGFAPVQAFIESTVSDANVIGIKQTLYRVGAESPVVEALLESAEKNKQVAAMVELKARFDESNNLVWARTLERAGVHVTFGIPEMKVHCKLCLIVRRENSGTKMYAHIGTGNYNPVTSKIYTDFGLFTADPELTQDILEMFNFLTGYSQQIKYRRLLVAPLNLREGIIERIEREVTHAQAGRVAHLVFKLNSLVDPEVIDALYDASRAGVRIDLIIRGICCLRPGVPGLSETIAVRSIVGRFLEHSRVCYFENGGEPEALIGSADLMRRNLDRRIEVLVPLHDRAQVAHMRSHVLAACLADNTNSWLLDASGEYRRSSSGDDKPFSAQAHLMANPTTRALYS